MDNKSQRWDYDNLVTVAIMGAYQIPQKRIAKEVGRTVGGIRNVIDFLNIKHPAKRYPNHYVTSQIRNEIEVAKQRQPRYVKLRNGMVIDMANHMALSYLKEEDPKQMKMEFTEEALGYMNPKQKHGKEIEDEAIKTSAEVGFNEYIESELDQLRFTVHQLKRELESTNKRITEQLVPEERQEVGVPSRGVTEIKEDDLDTSMIVCSLLQNGYRFLLIPNQYMNYSGFGMGSPEHDKAGHANAERLVKWTKETDNRFFVTSSPEAAYQFLSGGSLHDLLEVRFA